ncbi:Sir2 family NAD-dependent protein deacetylase [Halomonas sp. 1513]|nr:SIR2 family protein [Halomonas sp. 1513]APX94193.1 Sir2 family NAD-dependent protein deacetylase [Halomonas sp. 1513]
MQELAAAIREKRAVLFAGAGLSMNLGLPSFGRLIDKLAVDLDFDPEVFHSCGDYLALAEFYYQKKGSLGPLRSWMDTTWHSGDIDLERSDIHKTIVELEFPTIYTTNYDRWIERAFELWGKDFCKIASVSDLAAAHDSLPQIVKLHGDFDDDESIVLTESSYFDRLDFESPLDIKLRSDVLGKTILFLGYSLSDINIRYLLHKLQKQWTQSSNGKGRPKSYIFLTKPNIVQEELLRARGVTPIVAESDDAKEATLSFLKELMHEAYGKTAAL